MELGPAAPRSRRSTRTSTWAGGGGKGRVQALRASGPPDLPGFLDLRGFEVWAGRRKTGSGSSRHAKTTTPLSFSLLILEAPHGMIAQL